MQIKCSKCGQSLRVNSGAGGQVVQCPKCQQRLRIRAPKQATTSAQPAARPSAAKQPFDDFGGLDLATSQQANVTPSPLNRANRVQPSTSGLSRVTTWMNHHRWLTIVGLLNAIFMVLCLRVSPWWLLLWGIELVAGLIVIGLLQLPRKHVVERVCSVFGAAGAGMGAGGITLIVVVAAVKLLRIGGKVSMDPSVLGTVAVIFAAIAFCFWLWHQIGLARVISTLYVLQLACLMLPMTVMEKPDSGERRQVASRSGAGPTTDHRPPMFRPHGPTAHGNQRSHVMRPIRIVVTHQPDQSIASIHASLRQSAGDTLRQVGRQHGRIIFIARHNGPVDELAESIDVGTVTVVNRAGREILVDAT